MGEGRVCRYTFLHRHGRHSLCKLRLRSRGLILRGASLRQQQLARVHRAESLPFLRQSSRVDPVIVTAEDAPVREAVAVLVIDAVVSGVAGVRGDRRLCHRAGVRHCRVAKCVVWVAGGHLLCGGRISVFVRSRSFLVAHRDHGLQASASPP